MTAFFLFADAEGPLFYSVSHHMWIFKVFLAARVVGCLVTHGMRLRLPARRCSVDVGHVIFHVLNKHLHHAAPSGVGFSRPGEFTYRSDTGSADLPAQRSSVCLRSTWGDGAETLPRKTSVVIRIRGAIIWDGNYGWDFGWRSFNFTKIEEKSYIDWWWFKFISKYFSIIICDKVVHL